MFAIAALLMTSVSAFGKPLHARLGPQGDILVWLIAGPLPNPGNPHESCEGFDKDYLASKGGESGAAPAEGLSLGAEGLGLKWRLALASEANGLDLRAAMRGGDSGVAYASADIVSARERGVRLLVGSDDGVKVWVNGELRHTNHLRRGLLRDDDPVEITLKPGRNRLLFKVDQSVGGWGLMARLVEKDGSPARDLVESPYVLPGAGPRESFAVTTLRAVAGKPGSLDIAAAMRYEAAKAKALHLLARFADELDGASRLRKVLVAADKSVSQADWASADSVSAALIEAADSVGSLTDQQRNALVAKYQEPGPLVKADPAREDFVSVMPGGRYFAHADGSPFTPIGYNHNPDWSQLIESDPTRPGYDPKVTERFFKHLRKNGINLVRLMLETPASGMLENPIGTFRPEQVRWIDNIFTAARKSDIKLMITPWDTFWMTRQWDISPYDPARGGRVEKMIDFITKPEVREAQKKRLKFMVDRWGNSGTVFAWELLNEAELYWGASPEQLASWGSEMATCVREYERKKWGRNHLITMSIARAMPTGGLGDVAYRQPGFDLATTHLYIGASKAPTEPIEPALNIREGVTFALKAIKDNRPYIDGEDGPIDKWIANGRLDDSVFHNMTWAHLASGGAGSGLRWPYRHPHYISDGMMASLRRMRTFADEVPWTKLSGELSAEFDVQVPEGWIACRVGTPRAAVAWLRSKDEKASQGVALRIAWPDGPAKVQYRLYDTLAGKWIGSGNAQMKEGGFAIEVAKPAGSVAVVMEGM